MRALPIRPSTALITLLAVLLALSIPGAAAGIVAMLAFSWAIPHFLLLALALVAVITWRGKQHATRGSR